MSKTTYIAASATAFVLAASISTAALAWHPQGKITKEVMNVTTGSAYADANDAGSAVTAHPGDTLSYRITVVNPADPAANRDNDLAAIKVSDTLPTGVTVTGGAKDMDFGKDVSVVPQNSASGNKSVSYTFTAKVGNDVANGTTLCNIAAFTANSAVGDAPRSGVDQACVTIVVPPAPKQISVCDLTSKQIVTIAETSFDATKYSKDLSLCAIVPTTVTPFTPAPLPSTGINGGIVGVVGAALAALGYATVAFVRRRA